MAVSPPAYDTPAATDPITVAEAKTHLRVDGSDEDTYITELITVATDYAQVFTNRQFVTATLLVYFDAFPCVIELNRGPLQSVTSIKYYDTGGTQQTLDSAVYTVDTNSLMPRIVEAYSQTWPATRDIINAVEVKHVVGYGDAADVPQGIKSAIKLLVGHWFENREDSASVNLDLIPQGAASLLYPYKIDILPVA